jgi:hypothetical protein
MPAENAKATMQIWGIAVTDQGKHYFREGMPMANPELVNSTPLILGVVVLHYKTKP